MKKAIRQFDGLLRSIYENGASLLLEYDKLEFRNGRINGYKVPATVYVALHEFVLRTSNLHMKTIKGKKEKLEGDIWLNFGGLTLNNPKVKRFKVIVDKGNNISLEASMVELENGVAPFDDILAACCGNHCSNGSYDVCPGLASEKGEVISS